jgi:hypothetical protein
MKNYIFMILSIFISVLVFNDSYSQNAQSDRIDSLRSEVEWKSALATDTEAAWLDFIFRNWTSNRINDAVVHFQIHEHTFQNRPLFISDINPSFNMGSMVVFAHVSTSGQSSVSYFPVARASAYDSNTNQIKVQAQRMESETSGVFTVQPGNAKTFFCMVGSPSIWTGPEYSHYSGHGIVCVYAVPESSPNLDLSNRISNLVIIDVNFDREVAKVLTGSQVKKNVKKK